MHLTWTSQSPIAAGWYWWKGVDVDEGEIIEVFVQTREGESELRAWLARDERSFPLATIKGQFAGPLPYPVGEVQTDDSSAAEAD